MSEITSIFINYLDNLAWGPNAYFDAWPYQECASGSQLVSLKVLHFFLNGSLRYFDTLNKILRQLAEQFCKFGDKPPIPAKINNTSHQAQLISSIWG